MEFGKTDRSQLDHLDFTLPPDGVFTQHFLTGTRSPDLQVYVGAPKWGIKEWIGIIYPDKTKESDFLDHYVYHFNSIELNATHYKIYPESTIARWAQKAAGRHFRFCPKVPQQISHYTDLGTAKAQQLTDEFLRGVIHFGPTLGPVFLQLSERYGPQRKEALYNYLRKLPQDVRFMVEVRHPSWFEDVELHRELFGLLAELKIGSVITDTAGRRDCIHMEVTTPQTMIRFVGNGLHPSDYKRVDSWIERISDWINRGMEEVHFYIHQPGEVYSPELAAYTIEKLNKVCGLELQPPRFIERTGSLFD